MCLKKRKLQYNQTRKFKISTQYDVDSQDKINYPSNFISTSKYTLVDFIPLSLLMQFSRYANIYFLFIAIISSIPSISPLDPITSILPLLFVLAVSMTREGYEDYQRHINDNKLNSTEAIRIEQNQEKKCTWKDIMVGDIIKVQNNQAFPADLLVLSSEYENGNCYIETGALDGEKNMKPKQAIKETQKLFKNGGNYEDLNIDVQGEVPNQDLYQFEGSLFIKKDKQEKSLLAGPKQLLLRGAFLRNTEYVLGVVVYTGLDTKIMRNAEPGKLKQSDVERKMNRYIVGILITQIILSLLMGLLGQYWIDENYDKHVYLDYDEDDTSGEFGMKNFFTYFILFNTMIPISLIVSLEIVKMCQSLFIVFDDDMYVKEKDRRPNVFTSTLNEEVGQIEYVFSDKTGTLTCNVMEFKICLIGGKQYGSLNSDYDMESEQQIEIEKEVQKPDEEEFSLTKYTFKDEELDGLLKNKTNNDSVSQVISSSDGKASITINSQFDLAREYFTLLSTAHECIVQKSKNQEITDLSKITYGGPSPDEITLVDAAKHLGFTFLGSSSNSIILNILGEEIQFELLKLFEFDSNRKRMSVIVRDMNTKVIRMYTKGADSIIKERLSKEQQNVRFVDQKLHEFSILGLRTLLMTVKVISEEEYQDFDTRYNNLANVEGRDKLQKDLQSEIEQNLTLIGASAVEDKLQDRVPETIFDLIRANIKVWMLTGDKLETAENIGKSCKLVQDDMEKFYLTQTSEQEVKKYIFGEAEELFQRCLKHEQRKALLIQGETLAIVLGNQELLNQFVRITQKCESVICCRVTPKQKALVVRSIKNSLKTITLAIGDGANDVNMIQEAHIGVGIYGNEGMRAVQASDFAFGEFQCLWRLILVHGRWSYIRNTEMILYFFYKNMLFTIPHFFYAFVNGFSGQIIFDDTYILLYNMVFTALPLCARAIFDQDVNYKVFIDKEKQKDMNPRLLKKKEFYAKKKFPELYYIGQQQKLFSLKVFLNWVLQGIFHSAFLYIIIHFSLMKSVSQDGGYNTDIWSFSLILFTCVILIVSIKLALYTKYWTIFNYIAFWATSVLLYFAYFFVTEFVEFTHVYRTPLQLLSSSHFYLIVLLCCGTIFAFDMCVYSVQRNIIDFGKSDILRNFMRQNNVFKHKKEIIQILPDENMGNDFLKSYNSIALQNDGEYQKIIQVENDTKDKFYQQSSPMQNVDEKVAYDPNVPQNTVKETNPSAVINTQSQSHNVSQVQAAHNQSANKRHSKTQNTNEPEIITVKQNGSQAGPSQEIFIERGIQSASRNKLQMENNNNNELEEVKSQEQHQVEEEDEETIKEKKEIFQEGPIQDFNISNSKAKHSCDNDLIQLESIDRINC